jgi:hypothetical protein
MSLIWPTEAGMATGTGPALHAFIVGVGAYPHLEQGGGAAAEDNLGLGQVTTPHHTVLAIADWLRSRYAHPDVKLGSIELLLSTTMDSRLADGTPVQPQTATLEHFKQAFRAWRKRCESNRDNLAFFYFCGHGLHASDQLLLLEDFGNPEEGRWENCVNFDRMRVGMRHAKVQNQLYFIDACREAPLGVATALHAEGYSPIAAEVFDTVHCSAAYYASTHGLQASGPSNGVSYFGQAVLTCLNGGGARSKRGQWMVDSFQLGAALGQIMEVFQLKYGQRLSCHADVSGLALVNVVEHGLPVVLAIVDCTDPGASKAADITLENGIATFNSPAGCVKPLCQEVTAGHWQVHVRFPGGQHTDVLAQSYTLMPPVFEGVPVP